MNFVADYNHPEDIADNSFWFMICDQKIIVFSRDEKSVIPQYKDLREYGIVSEKNHYMGTLNSVPCYAAEIDGSYDLPESFSFHPPLSLINKIGEELVRVAGLANQLVYWNKTHRFCGKCGKPTQNKKDERAKICTACSQVYYPRLSPAIIVAVVKGDKILLAHSPRFPGKFYSVLAGFVEQGENLEECVKREVREEVGIEVENIKYFGSQPWPFPDSLMVAFTAKYAGGKIGVDNKEIDDAGWFTKDEIPRIPPSISIARKLIDWFQEGE